MKAHSLLEQRNPRYRPGEPYWELDIDNKVYNVHSEDGAIVASFPFEHVWDSSPAKRSAQAEYNRVFTEYRDKKLKADNEISQRKPLSPVEIMYQDLSVKVEKYRALIWPKDGSVSILDKETRDIYMDQATKWLERMNRLASHGTVRKSLIDGTYDADYKGK